MGLHRLSVGNRLVAGFLIVVLGMVAVTALGVIRVGQVSDRLTVINELNSVKQRYAINFRGSVHDRAISLRDVVLAWTPAEVEGHVADIERLAGDYAASAEKLDEFFADDTLVTPGRGGRLRGHPGHRGADAAAGRRGDRPARRRRRHGRLAGAHDARSRRCSPTGSPRSTC